MSWLRWWRRRLEARKLEAKREEEEAAMRRRLEAERQLRETTERWPEVNQAADAVARLRRSDRDNFIEELANAMKPRHGNAPRHPPHRSREA